MNQSRKPTLTKLARAFSAAGLVISMLTFTAHINAAEKLEKESLKFGFIKLTDMAFSGRL